MFINSNQTPDALNEMCYPFSPATTTFPFWSKIFFDITTSHNVIERWILKEPRLVPISKALEIEVSKIKNMYKSVNRNSYNIYSENRSINNWKHKNLGCLGETKT